MDDKVSPFPRTLIFFLMTLVLNGCFGGTDGNLTEGDPPPADPSEYPKTFDCSDTNENLLRVTVKSEVPDGAFPLEIEYAGMAVYDPKEWIAIADSQGNEPETFYPTNESGTYYSYRYRSGSYEVRYYINYGSQQIFETCAFVLPSHTQAILTVTPEKNTFNTGEEIPLTLTNAAPSENTWATLVPASAAQSAYEEFFTVVEGLGSYTFQGKNSPGAYEIRVFDDRIPVSVTPITIE